MIVGELRRMLARYGEDLPVQVVTVGGEPWPAGRAALDVCPVEAWKAHLDQGAYALTVEERQRLDETAPGTVLILA
jgi:hypothetical protein